MCRVKRDGAFFDIVNIAPVIRLTNANVLCILAKIRTLKKEYKMSIKKEGPMVPIPVLKKTRSKFRYYLLVLVIMVVGMLGFVMWKTSQQLKSAESNMSEVKQKLQEAELYIRAENEEIIWPKADAYTSFATLKVRGKDEYCSLGSEAVLEKVQEKEGYLLCRVRRNGNEIKLRFPCPIETETVITKEEWETRRRMASNAWVEQEKKRRLREAEKLFD